MIKVNTKLAAGAALSAVLLAGCGGDGGGGGGGGGGVSNASCSQTQTVASDSVVSFINQVLALNEYSEPIDINCVTLLTDDTVEPQAIL